MKTKHKLVDSFLLKITMEYMSFKMNVLIKMNNEIFGMAYEIDYMTRIYVILRDNVDFISVYLLKDVYGRNNLIRELYEEWLNVDDSSEGELNLFVKGYFENKTKNRNVKGVAAI